MINVVNDMALEKEAIRFLRLFYEEMKLSSESRERRITEVTSLLRETGTYAHTPEELTFGARVAWRNNSRCIGRLFWESLEVIDKRDLRTEEEIAEALIEHVRYATNGGRIRPTITVFRPEGNDDGDIRIWNHQLIRYAGYRTAEGIIGDPASIAFTERCMALGWKGREEKYDLLPLVIQIGEREPKWFDIPEDCVLEVKLTHPELERLNELRLQWYAVPMISDMALEIGGIRHSAAPFNGWYMGTEIGARNLADADRYDELPAIADALGFDRSTNSSLWKDRALLELNVAVIHSFKANGVSIVDHHTAADQFMRFMKREQANVREVNARWSWLIPPMSPAATPIWNQSDLTEKNVRPDYVAQKCPYE